MPTSMIITLAVAGLISLAMATFFYRIRPASIVGFSWERSVDIYDEYWVWRSSYWGAPAGSRNRRSQTVRTSRPVQRVEWKTEYVFGKLQRRPAYRTEWVYENRTLYTYEVPKRRYSHTLKESGDTRAGVVWPKATGHVGSKRERYRVEFAGVDGKRYRMNMREARWRTVDENKNYLISVTWYGLVLRAREEAVGV